MLIFYCFNTQSNGGSGCFFAHAQFWPRVFTIASLLLLLLLKKRAQQKTKELKKLFILQLR
jgi:hypothetical protein